MTLRRKCTRTSLIKIIFYHYFSRTKPWIPPTPGQVQCSGLVLVGLSVSSQSHLGHSATIRTKDPRQRRQNCTVTAPPTRVLNRRGRRCSTGCRHTRPRGLRTSRVRGHTCTSGQIQAPPCIHSNPSPAPPLRYQQNDSQSLFLNHIQK